MYFHYSSKASKAKKTNPAHCNIIVYWHGSGGTRSKNSRLLPRWKGVGEACKKIRWIIFYGFLICTVN